MTDRLAFSHQVPAPDDGTVRFFYGVVHTAAYIFVDPIAALPDLKKPLAAIYEFATHSFLGSTLPGSARHQL